MAELLECVTDDSWKQSLQSEIITALTESGQTQNHALEQVGYYYQCCAPAFLYKYYRDQPLNLNSVMSNKMWQSAPHNFNDAFDCDIAIDEQAILKSLLPGVPGGKIIREGSYAWFQLKSNNACNEFLNPIIQNNIHINACKQILNKYKLPYYSIIVFGNNCTIPNITQYRAKNVFVIRKKECSALINQIISKQHMYSNQLIDTISELVKVKSKQYIPEK